MKTLSTQLNSQQTSGFQEITHGIDVDCFLYKSELKVQRAWANGLAKLGLFSSSEQSSLLATFGDLEIEMSGDSFQWKVEDEDIHMTIERLVTERLGDLGKRMHLGRSRNDLIATTVKLFLAESSVEFSAELQSLSGQFLGLSRRDIDILVPSYTHSQAAQPIRMAHNWNFHALNFLEDARRFEALEKNILRLMPLGSAAIAGTHLEIDLKEVARELGFKYGPVNSIHGVSDRDSVVEFSQTLALFALHLTRLCDDIINWSSSAMGLIELPPAWASGSSIMPNKRNPDFFEIVRAKARSLISLSQEVVLINTSLTTGYASDLHEQKRVIVRGILEAQKLFRSLGDSVSGLMVRPHRATELLSQGHILATDVANKFVSEGMTFRDAYKKVAAHVVEAESVGRQLDADGISFESAVESRKNFGGTALAEIKNTWAWLEEQLAVR